MPYISRRTFLELAGASLVCGCGGESSLGGNNGSEVLVFSDVHFNPFYDTALFHRLDAADPSQWQTIFESSAITAVSIAGADTNYPLFKLALDSIQQNLGSSQVIVYSGDLLGHELTQQYQTNSGNSDPAAANNFVNKTALFVMQQIRRVAGSIPIVFAMGNCDSYTGYGPDSSFLNSTADLYYSLMLNGTGDRQAFLDTFKTAGYYSVELFDRKLMVIGLNTILCSAMIPGDNSGLVNPQLAWFDAKLAAAKTAGQSVWLVMHVPVGSSVSQIAATVNPDRQISSATMMWITAYQDTFLATLNKYPGVLTMCIAGHTHMDEYRIMSADYVLEIAPGISPCFGNDPAFKVFTLDRSGFVPSNYRSINYDLATLPKQFQAYYTFSDAYGLPGCSVASLQKLYPSLASIKAKQDLFRQFYYSGNNACNPISNLTWPVYWSSVGNMSQQAIVAAVNAYR